MDFRWVASIALWTFLSGPAFGPPAGPGYGPNKHAAVAAQSGSGGTTSKRQSRSTTSTSRGKPMVQRDR
jgi:hypothetical protein